MTGRLTLLLCFTISFCSGQTNTGPLHKIDLQNASARLFVFLSPECPLSRNYTKVINDICKQYAGEIEVTGIIPGITYTPDEIEYFRKKYRIPYELVADTAMKITGSLQATITPEVVLVDSLGHTIYIGAIDDWVEKLGKNKLKPTRLYLKNAIDQYLSSSTILVKKTNAVGCKINDY